MGLKKDKAIASIKRAFPGSTVPIGTRLISMGSESDASKTARAFIKVGRAVMSLRTSKKPEISGGFAGRTGEFSVAEEAETTQILSQGGPAKSLALLIREGDSERILARPRAIAAITKDPPTKRKRVQVESHTRSFPKSLRQRDFDRA